MQKYNGELKPGLKLIYDGSPIQWANRTGTIVDELKKGKYIITRTTGSSVFIKADRSNAKKEYILGRDELEGQIFEPEFSDLTTPIAVAFVLNKRWYINNEELIKKAKRYNKSK